MKDLTIGNYKKQIINLALPMVFGMLGIIIFNIVDAAYLGRLGTKELAAISFTFPVIMIVSSVSMGMGMGVSAILSVTLGKGDHYLASRYTSDGLLLAVIIVLLVVLLGLSTITPVFRLLGAEGEVLKLIHQYMKIWYIGVAFVVVPQVGNNAIRAGGDTKTPATVMMLSALLNAILDPLFIFGLGPFPKMGIEGAALATVISRMISFCVAIYILYYRDKLLVFKIAPIKEVLHSWKEILYIGVPAAITRMITPLAMGFITGLLAVHGNNVVAGYGTATRIEGFVFVLNMAVGSVIGVFIGQNLGAKKIDRVFAGSRYANKLSLLSGLGLMIVLLAVAPLAGHIFTKDPDVQKYTTLYLRIMAVSYGFQGVFLNSNSILNVIRKPLLASAMVLIECIGLYIPLALIGDKIWGPKGIFAAIAISNIIAGLVSISVLRKQLNKKYNPNSHPLSLLKE